MRSVTPRLMPSVPDEPYPELPSVLAELVSGAKGVLGDSLVGVYLVGSLATGDFDMDSDVDFLVVVDRELTDDVVGALQAMHRRIHAVGCYPAQHLEGSYVSRDVLGDADAVDVRPLWYLDNGSTTFERSLHDNKWHVRWVLRERGIALYGPDPTTLLEPVPPDALRAEVSGMLVEMAHLFEADLDGPLSYWTSRFGQSYAVLTCCRMLHSLQTGTVRSKREGMLWALKAVDAEWHQVIRDAWREREGVRHCVKIRQRARAESLGE
ncbi:MAG: aminoglycoside adenylyltransferase domain-containing protein, partial [Anaerolineae bacterium]